jgi:hypothetical protein
MWKLPIHILVICFLYQISFTKGVTKDQNAQRQIDNLNKRNFIEINIIIEFTVL